MALMPRLRQLFRRPSTASTVAARRPSPAQEDRDTVPEDALRAILTDLAAAHGRWRLGDARQLGSDRLEVYERA